MGPIEVAASHICLHPRNALSQCFRTDVNLFQSHGELQNVILVFYDFFHLCGRPSRSFVTHHILLPRSCANMHAVGLAVNHRAHVDEAGVNGPCKEGLWEPRKGTTAWCSKPLLEPRVASWRRRLSCCAVAPSPYFSERLLSLATTIRHHPPSHDALC